MSTAQEVDEFYTKNYNRLINYIKNGKKGGDKVGTIPDDAIDILHDTYCYHKAHPEIFDGKFIWNVLKQRRMNFLRNKENYNSMKDDFYQNYYLVADWNKNEDLVDTLIIEETKGLIQQEIADVRNEKHKAILTHHIIRGNEVAREDIAARLVFHRFRAKMVEKYGDDDG